MYSKIINDINSGIEAFNKYLNPNFQVKLLDRTHLNNKVSSWNLQEESWDQRPFPSGGNKGVYFIFGKDSENHEKPGVYVGKASHSTSMIGVRLNKHLNTSERNEKVFKMNHKDGFMYLLEFVTTIPMDDFPFLASALEEYMIYHLKKLDSNLLNHIGNK